MKHEVDKEKGSRRKQKLVDEIGTALMLDDSFEQKQVSFLNRYFVFKKIVNLDASKVMSEPIELMEEKAEDDESEKLETVVEEVVKKTKKPKRTKKKLKLTLKKD